MAEKGVRADQGRPANRTEGDSKMLLGTLRRSRIGPAALGALVLSLALAAGAQASDPAPNDPGTASFTIGKHTAPAGSDATFTFKLTILGGPGNPSFTPPANGEFTLTDGQTATFESGAGLYRVEELTAAGWKLTAIECDEGGDTAPTDQTQVDLAAASATIELSPNEHKACWFTNTADVPPVVPPVTPPQIAPPPVVPPAVAPAQEVLPVKVRRAVAALSGPTKCVVAHYTVVVKGSPVTRVTFLVDGKRVRTLRASRGQRRFRVVLRATKRRSVVTARVRFAGDATPRAKTLHKAIRRCGRIAVAPKFTG